MSGDDELIVAGCGSADRHQPELFDAHARATVRYADVAAWITAAAVARATEALAAGLDPLRHEIGMAVVSDAGPGSAMAQEQANAEAGFSSPLRYAAASPGSLAGVACIALGFRGPTLNFTMRPVDGLPIALLMVRSWLTRGMARAAILASYAASGETGVARAVLLMPRTFSGEGTPFTSTRTDWLAQVGI